DGGRGRLGAIRRVQVNLTAALARREARAGYLPDEDGQAGGTRATANAIRHRRIAARDHHAPTAIDAVGEVIAQPAVLPAGHAGGAAVADSTLMNESSRGIDHRDAAARRIQRVADLRFIDECLHIWNGLAVVNVTVGIHHLVHLVPDHLDVAAGLRHAPWPQHPRIALWREAYRGRNLPS